MKRKRDELWEAVVALFYQSGVAKRERTHVNGIVEGFRQKGATPEEIRKRYDRYREMWPGMACTAEALFHNWDVMVPPKSKRCVTEHDTQVETECWYNGEGRPWGRNKAP